MSDLIELARRWKACKNFRWMCGMETDHYGIVVHADEEQWVEDGVWWGVSAFDQWNGQIPEEAIPDLSDPATVGLLEYQVLDLYCGEQFVTRATRALTLGGVQEVMWSVEDWKGLRLASGIAVSVRTYYAKIACLVDALERYKEEP